MDVCTCQNCRLPADWPQFTDAQLEPLAPLLPQGTGSRGKDTCRQLHGMLYALETGCAWRLLPTQFWPWRTVEARFERWAEKGVLRRAYHTLYPRQALADGRLIVVDGSYAKAHRSAAGARVDRSRPLCGLWCPEQCPPKRPWDCPLMQAIGKTRGGPNTNIVVAVNEDRQLVNWILLPGNVPESRAMPRLLEGIKPAVVVADPIHDNDQIRGMLANRRIEDGIRNHPRNTRNPYPWRPVMRKQHLADNYFADLKSFRRVATRYEKTAEAYDAVIALAALFIALRKDYPG